jgi:acyl-CoA thioester hydrolase
MTKNCNQGTPITLPACPNEKVPAPIRPFRHVAPLQPRFNDFDVLGHVNNSVYLQFMDLGKVSYFEAVTGGALDMSHIAVAIVNININFFSQAMMNEPLVVATACVKISQRSFTLEQRIINPETGDVKCAATTVMAAFDRKTLTSTLLAPEWVAALTRYEAMN